MSRAYGGWYRVVAEQGHHAQPNKTPKLAAEARVAARAFADDNPGVAVWLIGPFQTHADALAADVAELAMWRNPLYNKAAA